MFHWLAWVPRVANNSLEKNNKRTKTRKKNKEKEYTVTSNYWIWILLKFSVTSFQFTLLLVKLELCTLFSMQPPLGLSSMKVLSAELMQSLGSWLYTVTRTSYTTGPYGHTKIPFDPWQWQRVIVLY